MIIITTMKKAHPKHPMGRLYLIPGIGGGGGPNHLPLGGGGGLKPLLLGGGGPKPPGPRLNLPGPPCLCPKPPGPPGPCPGPLGPPCPGPQRPPTGI